MAVDNGEVIISEFPPLLLDLAFDLLPVSFNTVESMAISIVVSGGIEHVRGMK